MPDATFVRPDLGVFCRLDELGLEVVGQRLEPARAVLACRPVPGEFDRWCRRCGAEGKLFASPQAANGLPQIRQNSSPASFSGTFNGSFG